MADEDFRFVLRKKRDKTNKNHTKSNNYSRKTNSFINKKGEDELECNQQFGIEDHKRILLNCRSDLQSSNVWKSFQNHLTSTISSRPKSNISNGSTCHDEGIEIICFGIGNFLTDSIARYQMALLTMILDEPKVSSICYIYDPVLSLDEQNFVSLTDKMVLIEENEECKRQISKPTLFFMPHCGKTMYNNVLSANWGINLQNVILFGNSFKGYHERLISSQLKEEAVCIHKIIDYTKELPLDCDDIYFDTFNDLSLHYFVRLDNLQKDFWDCETESKSQVANEEIILREYES